MSLAVYRSLVPAEVRALFGYLAETGALSATAMVPLQREVESEIDDIIDAIYAEIERELREAIEEGRLDGPGDGCDPTFAYDTRLVLPALITHGHLHVRAGNVPGRRALPGHRIDRDLVDGSRETTNMVVRGLLDGDMRDAINDDEFEDFETNVRPRPEVARVAQSYLEAQVQEWLDAPDSPDEIREHYDHAVDLSEGHQHDDPRFRDLLSRLTEGDEDERASAAEAVIEEYKFASFESPPDLYPVACEFPYFRTQYERVGVLYEDMLHMYEAALDIELGASFKRSIVLMVIAAQIGLDDTDDYPEDRGTQLTPVTAELRLAEEPAAGVAAVRRIVEAYLDRAAEESPDAMTGIAVEYIRQQSRERIETLENRR